MMNFVNDPGSFIAGCGLGFIAGAAFKEGYYRVRRCWKKYKESREMKNGNGVNGSAHA